MSGNDIDLVFFDASAANRHFNALRLTLSVGQNEVCRVCIGGEPDDFRIDLCAASQGVVKTFDRKQTSAFGNDNAGSVFVERAARGCRIV